MDSIFSSIITPGMAGLAAAAIALMAVLGRIVIGGKKIEAITVKVIFVAETVTDWR